MNVFVVVGVDVVVDDAVNDLMVQIGFVVVIVD